MSRESTSTNAAFMLIKEGMEVIDVNDKSLGHVDYVRFGDDNPRDDYHTETATEPDETPAEEIAESVADAFVGRDDIPDELRQRLLRYGYLRLDGGLLHSDRFVTPDQVARVDEHVHLNVAGDDLLSA